MKRFSLVLILLSTLFSQNTVDEQVVARIKIEAFQNSQIMTTLSRITDVYGGRLTGSPTYLEAANWCVNQLVEWNINAQLEPWGVVKNGWTFDDVAVKVTSPYYFPVIAYPKAWTSGTAKPITGQPVLIDIQDSKDVEQYRGQLKGKIIFNGKPDSANPHFTADAQRMQADEQDELKTLMTPDEYYIPGASWKRYSKWLTTTDTITQFFAEESIAVLIEPSERDHGVVRLTRQTHDPNYVNAFPAIVIAREQYGRIYRLIENEFEVELNINIKTTDYADERWINKVIVSNLSIPDVSGDVLERLKYFNLYYRIIRFAAGESATPFYFSEQVKITDKINNIEKYYMDGCYGSISSLTPLSDNPYRHEPYQPVMFIYADARMSSLILEVRLAHPTMD